MNRFLRKPTIKSRLNSQRLIESNPLIGLEIHNYYAGKRERYKKMKKATQSPDKLKFSITKKAVRK